MGRLCLRAAAQQEHRRLLDAQGRLGELGLFVSHGGKFQLIALQGCGKGSGGSEVEFAVADQKLKMVVEDTGGFQNFIPRTIGTIDLPPGEHTLSVKPVSKPGTAVMDLRSITLKPVEAKE